MKVARLPYILVILAFLLVSCSPGSEADFEADVDADAEILNMAGGFLAYQRGDYAEALRNWSSLAEQGNVKAQVLLGSLHRLGRGFPQDDVKAARWLRMAAEQGDIDGQVQIGQMYALGAGVPRDYVLAYKWLELAIAQGEKEAAIPRNTFVGAMTPAQIAEAQRLAREWLAERE